MASGADVYGRGIIAGAVLFGAGVCCGFIVEGVYTIYKDRKSKKNNEEES